MDEKKSVQKKRIKLILRIMAFILLIIIMLLSLRQCGHIRFPWDKSKIIVAGDLFPGASDAVEGHLPGLTAEELMERMQKIADASKFSFKINARPVFKDGASAGSIEIENPRYNVYPMVVQIFLDEGGEMIYDSGGILPNQHIGMAKLQTHLPKGVYKATAYLNAYDPDSKVYKGRTAAALIITIKN